MPLNVGDVVRVKPSVSKPAYGWGSVTHNSVGIVIRVDSDGDLKVDWPNSPGWNGKSSEMELVTANTTQAIQVPQHQHILKFHRRERGYNCDVCRRSFSAGDHSYYCSTCDFDACISCSSKYFTQPPTVASSQPPVGLSRLVESLKKEGAITSPAVIQAFLSVDRKKYCVGASDDEAYADRPYRSMQRNAVHLSAPSIYTRCVEHLDLQPGLSFLNVGSGTGYLSAVVATLIGPNAINHGIELRTSNVELSRTLAAERGLSSIVFHNRSIRAVDPKASMKFDRIYVGAAANAEERTLVAQLLKIGGLCVGPYDNASGGQQMLKLERYGTEGEVRLRETVLMGVNFSSLLRGRELTDVAHDTPANPLEPLALGSKSVPQPSTVAGSRPRVGQSVRVVDGHRKGQTGTLIEDDGSPNMPFKVRFSDSGILWLNLLDVEAVGPAGGGAVIALEGGSLAGGYRKDDRVTAGVACGKVAVGDAGTVIGPCTSECADKASRVCVEFDGGKGQINYVASIQINLITLAGGYRRGDRVTAAVAHGKVAVGDAGTVIGPCTAECADKASRVCVEFDGGKGQINYVASSQINLITLAGGYRRGDRVAAAIAHDKVAVGDAGTVIGPCSNQGNEHAQRVCVEFDGGKGQINYLASSQLTLITLAGGYRRGDRVTAAQAHDKVAVGDAGTVIGPCSNECADKANRVCVEFDGGKGQINYLASTQLNLSTIAGGYRRGDRVTAGVACGKVAVGDAGTVIGPCTAECADKTSRVCVEFDGGKGQINYLASTQLTLITLAGGYRRGDRVTAVIAHDKVAVGDAGTVIGPCTSESADKASRVCVEFDGGKGQINYVASIQINLITLAGGYRRGDRVTAAVAHGKVAVGDAGTVIGPCTSECADKASRVCVEFDGGKGQINYVASSQIQKVAEKSAADKAAAEKAAAEKAAAEKAAAEKAAAEKRTRDLFEAAKAGNNDELKRLIDLGGDVLWKNPNDSGMTALHYAAFGGHLACVETLLLAKVRLVDNLTPDEATALHSAACGGHVNCIEALLRANVRLDATKTDGDTALHRAACLNKPDAVTRLLAAGAGTAIRNKAGQTALDVARKEGHISVIALLEAAEKANPISSIVDSARLRFGSLLEEMEAAMKAQKAAAEKAAAEKAAAEKAAAEKAAAEKAAAEKAAAEKAAAEKAAAEKAAAEKAAAERAAAAAAAEAVALRRELEAMRATSEKAAAEAKAAAERAAAEAKKAAEKAAAEAKAAAERAAAEAKKAAEKAAAEAKAAAEKAAAEKAAAEKAAAEKAAAERAESAKPGPAAEPAAKLTAQLQRLPTAVSLFLNQWGLRFDTPAAGLALPERHAVPSQVTSKEAVRKLHRQQTVSHLPESWNAEERFAVPDVITEQMTQVVKSGVLALLPQGMQFQDFYPEVVISYASGRRLWQDCDGAGPGMYYAAGILKILHERGVRCFSGLHVPPGTDWEVFMLRLNSRRAQAKVLIVVLTAALFDSKPCLKELNAAIKKGIPVLPIRFEDKLPGHKDQWARFTDEESELMIYRVQEHLSKVNSIPHPGTVLTVPDSMNTVVGLIDKHLGIERTYISQGMAGNHDRDDSYEA